MDKKKVGYALGGLVLIAGAGYLYWRHVHKSKDVQAVNPNQAPTGQTKLTVTTDNSPINQGTVNPDKNVHVQQIKTSNSPAAVKLVGPNTVLQQGLGAITDKMLVAKFNGSGIYDANLNKAGTTKQGQQLGYAISAVPTSNGTYNLKFRDAGNNVRIVNSVAVNVLV